MDTNNSIIDESRGAGAAGAPPRSYDEWLRGASRWLMSLRPRTRFLMGLWLLFFVLSAVGLHGSSIGEAVRMWAPESPKQGFLYEDLPGFVQRTIDEKPALRDFAMGTSRPIRGDEWITDVPWILSQFDHKPRFPVINANIGNGQNMLVWRTVPVWHITALARPSTWGFFFLGQQRGLAWAWWFPVFSCFTALFLLMEIVLRGHQMLAAFAAFWFCASAYVVCWSLWPAYYAFFAILAVVAAYHILRSDRPGVQYLCGVLLGLSLAGFVMIIYPPWQISLAYLSVFIFAGLLIRDRLYLIFKSPGRTRAVALIIALALAGGLIASFVVTCLPDLKIMNETVYPGHRVSLGGDSRFWQSFRGMYNILSIYRPPAALGNETESSSFYHLFPAVLIALCFSRRLASKLGSVGWTMVGFIVLVCYFARVGIPESLAKLTMFSYIPPLRADLALGLCSIMLCVYVLALAQEQRQSGVNSSAKWEKAAPYIGAAGAFAIFLWCGIVLMSLADGFPGSSVVLLASLMAGAVSYFMLTGCTRLFCGMLGGVIIATTALFNPLVTRTDYIYESELGQQILKLNQQSEKPPLWIGYGSSYPNTLITMLGGRSLGGIQWPPQLELWHGIDPGHEYESIYNRYAHVSFNPGAEANSPTFSVFGIVVVVVTISPEHPVLKEMGLRYILAMGESQALIDQSRYSLVYASTRGTFSIFEIPSPAQ